jgi:uncharacterized protein YdaU (DUF1376 family)
MPYPYLAPACPAAQSSPQHQRTSSRQRNRATAKSKIHFVKYYSTEMLVDTARLDQAEDFAYRCIFDWVLETGDGLHDDDRLLARLTKTPPPAWAEIKARLLELGMIIIKAGRITIARCQALLAQAHEGVAQKQRAGRASAAARARRSATGKSQPVEGQFDFNGRSTTHDSELTTQLDPADAGSNPQSPPAGAFSGAAAPPDFYARPKEGNTEPRGAPAADLEAAYQAFTAAYPHLVDANATRRALAEALRQAPIGEICAGAENYRAWLHQPGNTTAPMNSARWLRREGWRDSRDVRALEVSDPNVVPLISAGGAIYARAQRRAFSPHQAHADRFRRMGIAVRDAQRVSGGQAAAPGF